MGTQESAATGPDVTEEIRRGDEAFFAERFDEAEAHYRSAVAADGSTPGLAAKLERAALNAATELGRGEHQAGIFADRYARTEREGAFQEPPDLGPPPPGPRPARDRLRPLKVRTGKVLGAAGSAFFHGVTRTLGRHTNDRVWTNWYSSGKHLPGPLGKWVKILKLAHMRESLFANNVVRTYPEGATTGYADARREADVPEFARRWRTADGSWNDLRPKADGLIDPMVGAAYTRFFRNLGDDQGLAGVHPRENPATNPVSVREVSRKLLMPRGPRVEVPFLNLWAAAWIQFQNHDWISHGTPHSDRIDSVPLADDDPLREYGVDHLAIRASLPDPTRQPEDGDLPPTYVNEVTHWWDGSQIYGSDWQTQHSLRSHEGGRMLVTDEGLLPVDETSGTEHTGFMRNWWVGLSLLSTVFVKEHNAIAAMLAEHHPDWDDEALFQTARLVNAAAMARIHTLEWTPAILPNESLLDGMHANWFGLVTSLFGGERKQVLEDIPITSRELGGIVGNVQGDCPRYGLSEEFVSIYRMHSLLPDEIRMVDAAGNDNGTVPLGLTRHAASPRLFAEHGFEGLARTFGEQSACQLVNNNYPDTLSNVSVPGAPIADLGAIDLYRDRERGVPNYNQLRRELGLNPIESFDDLTDDLDCVRRLREVYGADDRGRDRVDDMDILVGTLSEGHRPTGFGFGETLFQIFIVNATFRLLGDRFFTIDYRADVYTPEGLAWVDNTRFKDVLLRHLPGLADTGLANVDNAFEPWDFGTLAPERHPLRAWDKSLKDPWAGDAPGLS
jgi:hypothetical protein